MNTRLISDLNDLAGIYAKIGDKYRERAYVKAAIAVRALTAPLDAKNLKILDIGAKMKAKLQSYLTTGHLEHDPSITAYSTFSSIKGVGPSTAADWTARGLNTIDGLRKAVTAGEIQLNNTQKYGLKYYEDLATRIPRDEVEAVFTEITTLAPSLTSAVVAGSYRRGATDSADVDIVFKSDNTKAISEAIEELKKSPQFVTTLMQGEDRLLLLWRSGQTNKQIVRQIDVTRAPSDSFYVTLQYMTGNYLHNIRMRSAAKALGMKLTQDGLYRADGKKEPIQSEEELYMKIGQPYLEPVQRTE